MYNVPSPIVTKDSYLITSSLLIKKNNNIIFLTVLMRNKKLLMLIYGIFDSRIKKYYVLNSIWSICFLRPAKI